MSERLEERLKRMIVDRLFLRLAPDDIAEDKSLVDDYGVDSVQLLELVVGLEEEFGLVIDDDEFKVDNFRSVANLAAYVRGKLGEGASPA
jgi:acyl carrier protein